MPLSLHNSEWSINIYFSVFHLQGRGASSAIALKPLMFDTNTTTHLAALQYSAGKPWILTFMWMPLESDPPPKPSCRSSTQPATTWAQVPRQDSVCCHAPKKLPPDLNMIELHGACLENSDPWGFVLSEPMFG